MCPVVRNVPKPRSERHGIARFLSGGGYRAALFHLGAAQRLLNELGILTQIATICSVSGGSIFVADLARTAHHWPAPGLAVPSWEDRISRPFRRFTKRNLRTLPLAKRVLPRNWGTARSVLTHERVIRRVELGQAPRSGIGCRPPNVFDGLCIAMRLERTRGGHTPPL